MRPRRATLLLLVVATVGTLLSPSSHALATRHHRANGMGAAAASCFPKEREALLAFKQGITDDPAGLLHSWNQRDEDCCKWRGVRCSNLTGHVIALHLSGSAARLLVGQISPSLLSLHHLEHLDLSMNNLTTPTGSVPEFLGRLRNLRYLDLSYMSFTGSVPSSLGNLSKLHHLDLSNNPFFLYENYLYSTDISWLSKLPLRHLNMGSVNLSTAIDWAHVVNMVPSLKVLDLSDCSLASANQSLPYLNLTGLEELSLSGNYFNNPLASCWLWNVTGLKNLELAVNKFLGQIPDALGGMTSLQVLDLSYTFSSTEIMKADMTNLCNLEFLDISYNYMNGSIMDLLPHCSPNKLKELYLQHNNFTGVLPDWIGHRWSTLLILELYTNQFSGPVPSEIGSLNNLQHLDLSLNRFNGSVPSEIGRLNDLLRLDLSLNRFSGPVPSEILMLSKLTYIDLSNNNLTGVVALEHLSGLINLTTIDLSSNYLKIKIVPPEWSPLFRLEYANFASCEMGPLFPGWLKTQANIVELNMSSVSIFDRIPDWFFTAYSNARTLDISNNAISGTLPQDLVNMTSLNKLYLNSNHLTGPVPQLPLNLKQLDISENSFSGTLSSDFGTQNLQYLNLASNSLIGPIPQSVCQMDLSLLNLANNYFDGEFPLCTGPRYITILILHNNKLSGSFPSSLKLWKALYILDLAWNKFSGRLPMWIGDFAELGILQLSHNKFSGSIPSSITRLKKLSQLNLAGNRLSGLLPPYLSNLTGMTRAYSPTFSGFTYSFLYGSVIRADTYGPSPINTHVNLSVITKGQERYYRDSGLYGMVSIDLSSNQLYGGIPVEITYLGGVINLNLSWNQFSGIIPGEIGVMQSLESLDLKENNLDGEIPQSLSNISYLSYLDLSYNNLTGQIPSGGQLDTLYAQYPFMYNGNSGLCGLPLKKNCSNNSEQKHGDLERDEHGFKALSFSFGIGIGYLVGLWVVFCLILFKKSWRIAYFRFFDMAFDRVYVLAVLIWSRMDKKATMH